ncbi:hypothetical protein BJY16_005450 [Actinoplanes octamycinicus]|uniref:Uncharacterized protein n=1 Tax=Actinoplanes octamycinicus TaxID=135948 RepID=A0A7W7M9L5_9ACTN|nr:hypothetical protein [Actinoplanes octamycinicus]GIE60754.1 hypothetical protein Aoc01nite_61560 [Actinoplanes octamycinicus]
MTNRKKVADGAVSAPEQWTFPPMTLPQAGLVHPHYRIGA